MSIKTIDQETRSNTEGIKKRINKGAERMVFDILQSTQYSNPIPSTIRELVSNACDSQREKEIAIEILTGVKQEEDYYIRREGDQYSDSNFNPNYYDLNCLNTENNDVVIKYYRNEGVGYCDTIEIIDHGVGIGANRLEGILELGFSTKRNTSQNFGAFGLGAKVALSTGVDFYTIETIHNGKRFKCNCYPYKTDFMIPKFNPSIEFLDGTKVHYEEVPKILNKTVVSFGVKKHNRNRFEESIQDQLNYLGNVKLIIVENGHEFEKSIQTNILHNSKHIIVSDSYTYSKPHIVIVKEEGATTGINYGYVDFRELEMEQLYGSVGLKCPIRQAIRDPETNEEIVIQDGVEVTPSREKVIWNEQTKKFIQGVIEQAAEEASSLVEDQLQDTDFFQWIKSCRDVLNKSMSSGGSSALRQISKIIDTSKMRPKFSLDESIKYQPVENLLRGYSVRKVTEYIKAGKINLTTDKPVNWGDVNFDGIYYKDSDTSRSKIKDHYLLSEHGGKILIITDSNLDTLKSKAEDDSLPNLDKAAYLKEYNSILANKNRIGAHLTSSKLLNSYEDVEVPQNWIDEFEDKEKVVEKQDVLTNLTPAEKREIEKRIVAYTLRFNHRYNYGNEGTEAFTWDKVEPKLSTIMASDRITYYGTKKDSEKLFMAANVLFNQTPRSGKITNVPYYFAHDVLNSDPVFYIDELPVRFGSFKFKDDFNYTTPQLLRVSESNIKHISKNSNCKHIDEFYVQLGADQNSYTMDHSLIKYMTGKAVGDLPDWISNIQFINSDYKDMYNTLREYKDSYCDIRRTSDDEMNNILEMVKSIKEFQLFLNTVDDENLIAQKSKELFIFEDIKSAEAVDLQVFKLIEAKDELISGINSFMEQISFPYDLSQEFQSEVTHYLKSRGKLDIEIPLPQEN